MTPIKRVASWAVSAIGQHVLRDRSRDECRAIVEDRLRAGEHRHDEGGAFRSGFQEVPNPDRHDHGVSCSQLDGHLVEMPQASTGCDGERIQMVVAMWGESVARRRYDAVERALEPAA